MQFGVNGLKHAKPSVLWYFQVNFSLSLFITAMSDGMISTPAVCFLLDVTLLDSLFIQILYELFSLHPVDERADVAAVSEKRPASKVQSTSCKDRRWHAVTLDSPAGSLKVCVSCAWPIKYHIISHQCLQSQWHQQNLFMLFCRKHEDLQFFVDSP